MSGFEFTFAGAQLTALGSAALWWDAEGCLCVSDLHLGKAERQARRGGTALPPYETRDTLDRLQQLIAQFSPQCVICLGDSFDDDAAALALTQQDKDHLDHLTRGRRWIWVEGNHDPCPTPFGGEHLAEFALGPLTFRHIANPAAEAEISGHYHPKARLRGTSRPAFLLDKRRLILPAFGTFTGGLRSSDPALSGLMQPGALAILTGKQPMPIPMPRR
ncbi:hypothetical protein RSK20926_12439 [Roseobacter sp. SK209-2-6]|uniref:ligase-associated DNA damage response endonuclease PdeM n=1 Tax=Roseobacter sp. SK209-2-6 TaxID=388739 RepID=UPI0000F3C74F|nr:ligase-associated DNA damage response endonuclease PdeM [Roseobacter sp. SK209-2-6]EBA18529.1 hypothetical protein RSK20926_12439 [Roseobacter sp. SK209-2-6]